MSEKKEISIAMCSPTYGKASEQAMRVANQILIQAYQTGIHTIKIIIVPSEEIQKLHDKIDILEKKLGIQNPNIFIDEEL